MTVHLNSFLFLIPQKNLIKEFHGQNVWIEIFYTTQFKNNFSITEIKVNPYVLDKIILEGLIKEILTSVSNNQNTFWTDKKNELEEKALLG